MDLKSKKVKTAEFKVIEFNKEFKESSFSHRYLQRRRKKNVKESSSRNVTSSSNNEERSTLGDIDALAELKRKMEEGK
jgi:small subunit ribosomal protein S1